MKMAFSENILMQICFIDMKIIITILTGTPRNVGVFPVGTHGNGTKSLH